LPNEPRFVTCKEAIYFNSHVVRDTGECHVLLNEGALQNAISKPINRFNILRDGDVRNLTAALIYGISKAHAFEQGNKRTAFKAGLFFIEQNGYGYHGATNGMNLGLKIIELCENNASEDDLANFLKKSFIFKMGQKQGFIQRIWN